MFAFFNAIRKPARRTVLGLAAAAGLAACTPVAGPGGGGAQGPAVDRSRPVPVALLVPSSGSGGASAIAQSLENAARLAAADLEGAEIDLRVYDTAGDPGRAASAASQAVAEGAQIILGPLYTQTTSAVTGAVSGRNINVLSFSNNAAVAGGNVFILGRSFRNVADRLTGYARRQGLGSVAVVHAEDLAGVAGRDAIMRAARANGMTVAEVQSYPRSREGIIGAGPRIANAITSSGADSVFLTANVASDLPLIATTLPENGVDPDAFQYLGLTQWSSTPQALSLPGLQGGLFALPDRSVRNQFERRYQAAYGTAPHPLAGLAFDGIQAIGSLVADGRSDALSARALTQRAGFAGASGIFRLRADGTNERGLAVAQIRNRQVVIVDPAPRNFGGAGL